MNVPDLIIGKTIIRPPFLLAPMAGYTDSAFRYICLRYGAGAAFTEVANADGIDRNIYRTTHLLAAEPDEHPLGAHIYGSDPDVMARAAARIEAMGRFDFMDINCGCPVRKIVKRGAGAALMKNPAMIEKIVRAVVSAVSMPVLIKTRIGFSPNNPNIEDVAKAAQAGGAVAMTVHGRFATNGHSGPADWDTISRLKKSISIPVIGNGGVNTAEAALNLLKSSGLDGVMIARGAVGHPWIFAEIKALLNGTTFSLPTEQEKRVLIMEHFDRLYRLKVEEVKHRRKKVMSAEAATALDFRAHLYKYLTGLPGVASVRRNLNSVNSRDAIIRSIDMAFSSSGI